MRNLKNKDLTGLVSGKWKALKRVSPPVHMKNQNHSYWLVECDCGNKKIIEGGKFRSKGSRGCRQCCMISRRKESGECSFNGLYLRYKHGAKSRNLSFVLTKEEFKSLTKMNCFYCGVPPSGIAKGKTSYGEYIYSGIDRLDSKVGYLYTNCLPCCETCNRAKSDMDFSDLKNWILRLVNFNKGEI